MTNWSGIESVVYIYNPSACSCSQPYCHSLVLYTELCEVLRAPKLCWFPNKAGLCPGGTNWGLFRPSGDQAQRERPPALWFWLHLWKPVWGPLSGQLHALFVLTSIIATDGLSTARTVRSSMLYSCGHTLPFCLFILGEIARPKGAMLQRPMQKPLSTHINIYVNII